MTDLTEHVEPFPVGYQDPHTQTGSDAETEPVPANEWTPLSKRFDNSHKWRMYRLTWKTMDPTWHVFQPVDVDEPMFDGLYSYVTTSATKALAALQLAMAKAAA